MSGSTCFNFFARFSTSALTWEVFPHRESTVSAINSLVEPFLRTALAVENGTVVSVAPQSPETSRLMLTFIRVSLSRFEFSGLIACRRANILFSGLMLWSEGVACFCLEPKSAESITSLPMRIIRYQVGSNRFCHASNSASSSSRLPLTMEYFNRLKRESLDDIISI